MFDIKSFTRQFQRNSRTDALTFAETIINLYDDDDNDDDDDDDDDDKKIIHHSCKLLLFNQEQTRRKFR